MRTITTHPEKLNPFGNSVKADMFNFDDPPALIRILSGAETLYNTYWVRFEYGDSTYAKALTNTRTFFECARKAGVKRIVHIGVTHASVDSDLPYYRGKGFQESVLAATGVDYSIVRPTLVFGAEDILVNNIAWLIRTFPVFPIFGSGHYRIQPVFVEDLAEIAIESAVRPSGTVVNAIGPETFTFEEMVRACRQISQTTVAAR